MMQTRSAPIHSEATKLDGPPQCTLRDARRPRRGRALRVVSETVKDQIETTLRDQLTPLFAIDGGTVELVGVQDGTVRLRFGGTYRGCPSVAFTVSGFVLPALRKALGRDVQVEVVP